MLFHSIRLMVPALLAKDWERVYQVNMEAVIPDWNISIKEAPLRHWVKRGKLICISSVQLSQRNIRSVLINPLSELLAKAINIIVIWQPEGARTSNGRFDADEPGFDDTCASGSEDRIGIHLRHEYEGIIPMLKRWFWRQQQ